MAGVTWRLSVRFLSAIRPNDFEVGCESFLKVTGKRPFYVGEVSDECREPSAKAAVSVSEWPTCARFREVAGTSSWKPGISKTDPDPADETPRL